MGHKYLRTFILSSSCLVIMLVWKTTFIQIYTGLQQGTVKLIARMNDYNYQSSFELYYIILPRI